MKSPEASGFSALSEAEARINAETAQTQVEADARDAAAQAVAEAYGDEVMRHEANAMNETFDQHKAEKKALDHAEAIVLNEQHDKDVTDFEKKVAALNEEAHIAVFGTNGQTEGYTDPKTGNPLSRPIKGIIDTMRENPRYGTKQAERDQAADNYEKNIQKLIDKGFEISQAKVVMDLREKRKEELALEKSQHESASGEELKEYTRKLALFTNQYVKNGHKHADAIDLAMERLGRPDVTEYTPQSNAKKIEKQYDRKLLKKVQQEGIYTLDASKNPVRPTTPTELRTPIDSRIDTDPIEEGEAPSTTDESVDTDDSHSVEPPVAPVVPPRPPELTDAARNDLPPRPPIPTFEGAEDYDELFTPENPEGHDSYTPENLDEDDGVELCAYNEIRGEFGRVYKSYGVKFNMPGKVISWEKVETVDGVPRMAIITKADGTELFLRDNQLYDLNKARVGEDPLIEEVPEGYEFPDLTIGSKYVSVEIALAEVEKHDDAKNLKKFTESGVDDPFDAAQELITNYTDNREGKIKRFLKEARQRIQENRTERLIDVKRDVAAGVAGAAATAEAVDVPSDPSENLPGEENPKEGRIKRAFKNAQQKIRDRISERLDKIEGDPDAEPESAKISLTQGKMDEGIQEYLRANGYVVNQHNLARVWDAVQYGMNEPDAHITDDGMVLEIPEEVRNNLILPKSRTAFLR